MALAYAPYNETGVEDGSAIEQLRSARHNKTIKKKPAEHVQRLLNSVHAYDDSEDNLADFNPPPPPELSKVKPTADMQSMSAPPSSSVSTSSSVSNSNSMGLSNSNSVGPSNSNSMGLSNSMSNSMGPSNSNSMGKAQDAIDMMGPDRSLTENFNMALPNTYSNDYFKQYVPYYNQMSQGAGNKDQLLEKLNYMIHMLEEQQEVKTGHVTEEIILYSFLGVFMIFIVDSFARAGPYTR